MSPIKSKALLSKLKIRGFERFNHTLHTYKPLIETLDNAITYFGSNPQVLNKINSLKKIVPKNESNYLEFQPSTITLGISQSKNIEPGLFVDSLIVDPLSNDNKAAKLIKEFRSANSNSNIKILGGFQDEAIGGGVFISKSPILNSETRLIQDAKLNDGTNKLLNRDLFNNLSFVEVNDKQFNHSIKVEGAESLNFDVLPKDDQIIESDCQIWVYVTSSTEKVEKINDLPYFVLNNNSKEISTIGTSLTENFKKNNFEVDLAKLNHANELVSENINNISEYLRLYQQSNMNELLYTINRETSGYKPLILLLRSLIRDLQFEESDDVEVSKELKQEITDWAQKSHFELQSKVTPFLENVLVKDLTKISQLIINSGDLTLIISNLLNGTRAKVKNGLFNEGVECYGSLQDAIANSYYLEGKIDTLFPEAVTPECEDSIENKITVNKFLYELQDKVASEKLPELQSNINKFLTKEIITVPFTIFALCNIGYLYDFVTLNTCFAITALSIAITANRSQKKIISIISEFKDWYLEQLRVYIEKTTTFLGERLVANISAYDLSQSKKRETVDELKLALLELEKADKKLKCGVDNVTNDVK
jgi:hypothetical protein